MARSDRSGKTRTYAILAVGAAASILVACNMLVGIDAFEDVGPCVKDCTDGGPDAPADGITDVTIDVSDGGTDAPVIVPIPDGASPVSWARWIMPNPSDSGGLYESDFSYTKRDGSVSDGSVTSASVTDERTHLVWGLTEGAAFSDRFDQALKFCETYQAGETWRLPSRIELVTLIDTTRTDAAIDPIFSGALHSGWTWTSSVVRPATLPYRFWAVDFGTGEVSDSPPSGNFNVVCVKGS